MRFKNQAAIVTGAGRGIGHAIAVRLASEGARIACVSRSEENAKRTADELNILRADSAKHYAVDVADREALFAAFSAARRLVRASPPVRAPGRYGADALLTSTVTRP